MRDMLTTISSMILIVFCFSLLMVSEETESVPGESETAANQLPGYRSGQRPVNNFFLFKKVQSVRLKKGVLIFVTMENEGLKEHYFQIRNKNVVVVKKISRRYAAQYHPV